MKKNTNTETKQHATEQWSNQRGNQKIPWDKGKWKQDFPKSMGCSKNCSKREVYSDTGIHTHTHTHTHTHIMEYYSAIKINEILPYVTTWIFMGYDKWNRERQILYDVTFMWSLINKTNKTKQNIDS